MQAELVPLSDRSNEVQIKHVISDMVSFVGTLSVDNEMAYRKITSMYRQAREWKKIIDGTRKQLVEPHRRETAKINDKAKELIDPLDKVIDLANSKASGYQKMLEEVKRKEDAKMREAASLFESDEELYIPPMQVSIRGDGAATVTKVEKKFRVLDITKVPIKYLVVDEEAIKKDLQLGIFEIPGIEVYEEKTTTLRMR